MMVSSFLSELGCPVETVEWAAPYGNDFRRAWMECDRPDWMLRILGLVGLDRKRLVLLACVCVRTALHHVPAGEDRPRLALEAAEDWARGRPGATLETVNAAASGAYFAGAAGAAYAAVAAHAAHAAHAAYAAASACAAGASAYAAYAAGAADASAAAARNGHRRLMAGLIRQRIRWNTVERLFVIHQLAGSQT